MQDMNELFEAEVPGRCVVCEGPTKFQGVDINGFDIYIHKRCADQATELGASLDDEPEPEPEQLKLWRNGPYGELP